MSTVIQRELKVKVNGLRDKPELRDSLVSGHFRPRDVEITYVWRPEGGWKVGEAVVTGTGGSARFGRGQIQRVSQGPDWLRELVQEHRPGVNW